MLNGKSCIICESANVKDIFIDENYTLTQCIKCKLLFDNKPRTNLQISLYNKTYFKGTNIKGGYYNYFEDSRVNKLTFRSRLKNIKKHYKKTNANLLDIGCACGDFLEVSKEFNFNYRRGADVSQFAVRECIRKGLYVKRIKETKDLLSFNKEVKFDVITLQDVIEHYLNPLYELQHIIKMMKRDGLLFITTPNAASLSQRILKKYWYHYKKGEHIYYFSPDNLTQLLEKVGLKVIKIRNSPSWVTMKYLINRSVYYLKPLKFLRDSKITHNPLFNITFPIYTGEIEVWAKKVKV